MTIRASNTRNGWRVSNSRSSRWAMPSGIGTSDCTHSESSPRTTLPPKADSTTLPTKAGLTGTSYQKFLQPASGFAIVGVAARIRREAGKITVARIGVTGVSGNSYRALKAEAALVGKAGSDAEIDAAAALVGEGVEAGADLHASAEYRLHLAANYAERAIRVALSRTA